MSGRPRPPDADTLDSCRARIWRRFLVDRAATLFDLHEAIQDAFGWVNGHLWDFRTTGRRRRTLADYGDEEYGDVPDVPDVRVSSVL